MTKIALVGCGASKKKGVHKAKNLYTSTYFQLKKEYAEKVCDSWFILSAEHGIISPEKEIECYDSTVSEMSEAEIQEWARDVADSIHSYTDELGTDAYEADVHSLVWLAGEDYVKPVEQLVMDDIVEPFVPRSSLPFRSTSGIGDQMGWLKKKIKEAETERKNSSLGEFA